MEEEKTYESRSACEIDNLESQITEEFVIVRSRATNQNSILCCMKFCIILTNSLVLLPFAVCDVHYAESDDICVNQNRNHLAITLKKYLISSGIITLIGVCVMNLCIVFMDVNLFIERSRDRNMKYSFGNISIFVLRLFGLCWLILGCVLYFVYTDINQCNISSVYYLSVRFILAICSAIVFIVSVR